LSNKFYSATATGFLVFTEFERGNLSESIKAGLNSARQEGKVLGRLVKSANIKAILEDRTQGKTIRQISQEQKLLVGKVHKTVSSFNA